MLSEEGCGLARPGQNRADKTEWGRTEWEQDGTGQQSELSEQFREPFAARVRA